MSNLYWTAADCLKLLPFNPNDVDLLMQILVRCTDPVRPVRDLAIDAVGLVLDIMAKYLGYSRSYEQETVATLDRLKVHLGSDDPQEPLETIATILHSKIAPSDLWSFLEAMTEGLLDTLPASSSGLSLLMCIILKVLFAFHILFFTIRFTI